MSNATVYVTKGRIEFATTPLGAAAFDGDLLKVQAAIAAGIDWRIEENYPLEAAIYCENALVVKALLDAGAPVSERTYKAFYYYGTKEMLALLPPRPDLIAPLEEESRWSEFNHAIIHEDFSKVKTLVMPARINEVSDLIRSEGTMAPLHYAARAGNLPIIKFLLAQKASINAVNGQGKTALRLIAECPSITDEQRREAYRFLEGKGAILRPEITSWWRIFWLRRGTWLSS